LTIAKLANKQLNARPFYSKAKKETVTIAKHLFAYAL